MDFGLGKGKAVGDPAIITDPQPQPAPVGVSTSGTTAQFTVPVASQSALPTVGPNHMLKIWLGLLAGFLFFYVLADYTGFTAGQLHPGELVFSNTMVQLWTATYRLVFMFALSLGLIGLLWQGLFRFFKPGNNRDFDLMTSIRLDLTSQQRVWLFFAVLLSVCYLFVMLLGVKLPESVSVVP